VVAYLRPVNDNPVIASQNQLWQSVQRFVAGRLQILSTTAGTQFIVLNGEGVKPSRERRRATGLDQAASCT